MKTPFPAPPVGLRRKLGDEEYSYFEHLHGLIQGLGHRNEELGRLDAENLGIRGAKEGDLIAIDKDGVRARAQDPYVESLRSQSEGFLQADKNGRIGASPVDFEELVTNAVRQEFQNVEPTELVIDPGNTALVVGQAAIDSRRYAMLVSWVG